ncbi:MULTISPECIES: tetratricopeptide repeat protein [Clostridium]|uniref:tetratricopeptide repeat protein n=1 Tax=Clostridium TaxID=1485 RepID=UPI000825C410|nr:MULTISPECIES: tetratricopeptide repeat protein [Clostridium]PJI09259.1 hypothetical protein CUB90_15855 [Clostridium sp. CT7]
MIYKIMFDMAFIFICIAISVVILFAKSVFIVIKSKKLINKGQAHRAIDMLSRKISKTNSMDYLFYTYRADAYITIKNYNKALLDLWEASKKYTNILNFFYVGYIYCELGQYEIAKTYFLKATKIKPKSPIAYSYLGWFYYKTKDYNKALQALNKSIELKNTGEFYALNDAYLNFARVYTELHEYDKAIDSVKNVLKGKKKNSKAYIIYANLLRIKGDNAGARKYALKSIAINKYNELPYKILAEIALAEENYDEFYKEFKQFVSKKGIAVREDDIQDEIYDKVRNDEKFKELIKEKEDIISWKDLNIKFEDYEALALERKRKKEESVIKLKKPVIVMILITCVALYIVNKVIFRK